MATLPVPIPAIPDDAQLPTELGPHPDWHALTMAVEGVNGRDLVELGELGEQTLADLTDAYALVARHKEDFEHRYWESSFGAVEKAGKDFGTKVRLRETKRCDAFCEAVRAIQNEVREEVNRRAAQKAREAEAEQTRIALAERQAELARAAAERQAAMESGSDDAVVAELDAHIEAVKAEPLISAAVNEKAIARSIFQAPASLTGGRTVYARIVTDWPAFLKWLISNPSWITSLKLTVNFTAMKSNDTPIPGVKMISRVEGVQNRSE